MWIPLNPALRMFRLMHPQMLKHQPLLTLQLTKPTLWLAQLSDLELQISKENLIKDLTLIMLTCLQTRTILWFRLSMTLILPGKPILVSFKSIMLIMGHIAKKRQRSHLLKLPLRLTKTPKHLPLDNKRISRQHGKKPRSSRKSMHQLKIFQKVSSQLILIGEISKELISLLNIEIKVIVVPATLFLSPKLPNNV